MCWSRSASVRPTAQQLLHNLQGASHTWVPPLEYPIPDSTSGDGRSREAGALASSLFVLTVSMLWILLLPFT
jgi:hypothetical protein